MQAKRVSRQARRLQGGMYEAVRIRVERGLSESREKNNDFFRIPIRFKIRNSPQIVTIRRKDSDKPLPPIKRPRALRQPGPRLNLHVSPRGEAKWVRGPSGLGASRAEEKGASRLARAGVLEQYVEHGKQAQRSPGARIRVLRPSGGETCRLVSPRRPDGRPRRPVTACLHTVERLWRGMGGILPPSRCPRPVRIGNTACWVFTNHETRDTNHGLYSWPFGSLWVGKSRTTRNCRRTAAPANKLLLALPPIPAISHHFPAKNIAHEPVSVHRQPFSVGLESSAVSSRILRKCAESRVCGRLHEVCRCPQLPSPCEFVPPRRNAE